MRAGAVKCRRCHSVAAQAKYQKSEKGKATQRRYRVTGKGRANDAKFNARRIYIGEQYYGTSPDASVAATINAHVRERLRAFKASQPKG